MTRCVTDYDSERVFVNEDNSSVAQVSSHARWKTMGMLVRCLYNASSNCLEEGRLYTIHL